MNVHIDRFIFQNAATDTGNGIAFVVGMNDQVTVYITGTATSFTAVFEGSDTDGNWYPAPAFRMPDYTMSSQATVKGEAWVIDLTQWHSIRTRVSAISGGNLTIVGKIIKMNG